LPNEGSESRLRELAAVLEARGVGRREPSGSKWLFRAVSLEIETGERVALVGPTGSGKTLLLRALALLDPLDAGTILWDGRPVAAADVPAFRRQAICLHQRPVLLSGTVEENLRYPFTFRVHRGREFDRDRVLRLLSEVGRDESFLDKLDRDLSGGERQIVALIRAMQLAPAMLLLDEPTAALDPETTRAVETLVPHWFDGQPGRRSLVWVSHDSEQVRRMADRVLAIRAGQLAAET
jgi:putative ABC transport system ATP-binding protein